MTQLILTWFLLLFPFLEKNTKQLGHACCFYFLFLLLNLFSESVCILKSHQCFLIQTKGPSSIFMLDHFNIYDSAHSTNCFLFLFPSHLIFIASFLLLSLLYNVGVGSDFSNSSHFILWQLLMLEPLSLLGPNSF